MKKYNKLYKQLAETAKLPEQIYTLETSVEGPLTTNQQLEYERLDALLKKFSEAAELKCRRLKMGQVAWSPELQKALMEKKFWELMYRHSMGKSIGSRHLRRTAIAAGRLSDLSTPAAAIIDFRTAAHQAYKRQKKKATTMREKWLDDLALARSEAGLEKAANAARAMKTRENKVRKSRLRKRIMNPTHRTCLDSI